MSQAQRLHRAVNRVRRPRGDLGAVVRAALPEPRMVLQPIIAVPNGAVLAVEALARFAGGADAEDTFRAATATGRGAELEARCVRAALRRRAELPPGMLLAVNVSPNALTHLERGAVWPADLRGVVVEITEQEVDSPQDLGEQLERLRSRGAAIAIDDVSTGYAGLLRVAQMRPDYVKVDRRVVSGVGESSVQAAVLEALVTLSHRLGAAVIGEGVEDVADLAALGEFDVDYAQGYAIARPSDHRPDVAEAVVAACRANRRRVLRGTGSGMREVARTRDVYAVTAALASADHRQDIDAAIAATALDLGVDVIGVSILSTSMHLREIASTESLDPEVYSLDDYPATLAVLNGSGAMEVQLADAGADAAERAVMRRHGHASLLLVPVRDIDRSLGVVEFAHRSPRRWSVQDIAHAKGLAAHLCPVLRRLGVGTADVPAPAAL